MLMARNVQLSNLMISSC